MLLYFRPIDADFIVTLTLMSHDFKAVKSSFNDFINSRIVKYDLIDLIDLEL